MSTRSRKLTLGRKDDRPGVVKDTSNPSTWEVEAGEPFQGQLRGVTTASSRSVRADSSHQNGTRYELNTSYEFW